MRTGGVVGGVRTLPVTSAGHGKPALASPVVEPLARLCSVAPSTV